VGLGPVFFPAQRRFRQRPVHRQPIPLDPAQLIKLLDARLPQLEKHPSFHPGLKSVMCCRMGTQLGLVEGVPLAAGPQDVENRIGTGSIRHSRSSSAKAMGVDVNGQQWLKDGPQRIRNAKSGRGAVVR
jgi:hypothetical protein